MLAFLTLDPDTATDPLRDPKNPCLYFFELLLSKQQLETIKLNHLY